MIWGSKTQTYGVAPPETSTLEPPPPETKPWLRPCVQCCILLPCIRTVEWMAKHALDNERLRSAVANNNLISRPAVAFLHSPFELKFMT